MSSLGPLFDLIEHVEWNKHMGAFKKGKERTNWTVKSEKNILLMRSLKWKNSMISTKGMLYNFTC